MYRISGLVVTLKILCSRNVGFSEHFLYSCFHVHLAEMKKEQLEHVIKGHSTRGPAMILLLMLFFLLIKCSTKICFSTAVHCLKTEIGHALEFQMTQTGSTLNALEFLPSLEVNMQDYNLLTAEYQ